MSVLSPLAHNVPIVDSKGNPTPYFQRMLMTLLSEKLITDELAEAAVQGARQVIAGAGLTGGGDLTADRTFNVGAGTGITVNVDDIAADPEYIRDIVAAFVVAGTNMTVTHNDGANTLTFDATGGSGGGFLPPYVDHTANHLIPPYGFSTNSGTGSSGHNIIYFYLLTTDAEFDAITFRNTTAGAAGTLARGGLYTAHATTGLPDQLIVEGTTAPLDTTGVEKDITFTAYTPTEPVWIAFLLQATVTCYAPLTNVQMLANIYGNNFISLAQGYNHVRASYSFAALPANTSALTMTLNGTGMPSVCVRAT